VEREKRPDLIVLIAIWEFLAVAGVLIALLAISGIAFFFPVSVQTTPGGFFPRIPEAPNAVALLLGIGAFLALAYGAFSVVAGIGLLQGREWGWLLTVINAALSVFRFPVGTIIGVLVLIYLLRPEIRAYFNGGKPTAAP